MKSRKKSYEFAEKWVDCLDCSKEYVVEPLIDAGCPVCGSHEYEESINEYDGWGD